MGVLFSGVWTQASPPPAAAQAPSVEWRRCFRQPPLDLGIPPELWPKTFECGSVEVPLDYDEPGGRRFPIPLIRLPAGDPARRIGSLFVNPGGPGGSGFEMVLFGGPFLFTEEVRARFDLVGFDPRGILRSKPLICFQDPSQWEPYFTSFAFPLTPEDEAIWETADRYLVEACDRDGGRIQDHMATANAARDLDVLRQAVGDAGLSFAGYSYGSFLGTTYANLFPDNVRAVIVDGVLDPIAWTTGAAGQEQLPFSTRLRSDAGAQATLLEFFRLCDAGGPNCAFAPDAEQRFAALTTRLRIAPIDFVDPVTGETISITYQNLIGFTLGVLYDSFSWPFFAEILALIEQEASPVDLGARLEALRRQVFGRNFPRYPNFIEGGPGVFCTDSDNPDSYAAWSTAGAAADEQFGYFGRIWTWASSICAAWGGFDEDRYTGPFDAPTANPVLVIGNQFDPATRYEGAVTVHNLLPNSSLLTVHGWGHTSPFLSVCADQAVEAYLVALQTPAPGTVCQQDVVPFAQPLPQTTAAERAARQHVRSELLPDRISAVEP